MKRQADWEELWQPRATMPFSGADRWAPWFALAAAVVVAGVAGVF